MRLTLVLLTALLFLNVNQSSASVFCTAAPATPGTINGPLTPCMGDTVLYKVPFAANVDYWTWVVPFDWTIVSDPLQDSIYVLVGTMSDTIKVQAHNTCGITYSAFRTKYVKSITPPALPGIIGPDTVCQGAATLYLVDTPVAGAVAPYAWSHPGWTGSTSGYQVNITPGALSSGYIYLTAHNTCFTTTDSLYVLVKPLPLTAGPITGPNPSCVGSNSTFSVDPVSFATDYVWQIPGTWTGTSTINSITVLVGTGGGNVRVKGQNECGLSAAWSTIAATVSVPPTATLTFLSGSPTAICSGSTVTLKSNPATGTHSWMLDGVLVSGVTTANYTTGTPGVYTAIVTNAAGCSDTSAPLNVIGYTTPSALITPFGPTSFCYGDTVLLHSTPDSTGLTYKWRKGTVVIPGAIDPFYVASITGTYSVVINNNGCKDTSVGISVIASLQPPAVVTPADTQVVCFGGHILLKVNTGTGYTYEWFQDGVSLGVYTSGYNASATGSYTAVVTNGACSATSLPTTVLVEPLPLAIISVIGNDTVCNGDSTLLSANIGTGYTYQWELGGLDIPGATNSIYYAEAPGTYKVTVIKQPWGCTKTSLGKNITVLEAPNSTITWSNPLGFCEGGAVVLNASGGASDTIFYQWFNTGDTLEADTFSYLVATESGGYTLSTSNLFGCYTVSGPVDVTVYPTPTPPISLAGSTLSTASGYAAYQWYYNGSLVPGATSNSINAMTNYGGYKVVVTDAHGCTGESEVAFYNGLGISNSNTADGIRVYPNPMTLQLFIEADQPLNAELRDITGKTLILAPDVKRLDVSELPAGIYLLQLTNKNGQMVHAEKVIKTN